MVGQDGRRHTTEVTKAVNHAVKQGLNILPLGELDVLHGRRFQHRMHMVAISSAAVLRGIALVRTKARQFEIS